MMTFAENLASHDSRGNNRPFEDATAPGTTTEWIDDSRDEVILDELFPGDRILATTRNSTYEIVVESPWTGEVLLRGARLAGSLLGGSSLKIRSVDVGRRLEFTHDGVSSVRLGPRLSESSAVAHARA
jgi:hypothetical protein